MITHGDCLAYLDTLDDNSVDLVIADPPYFEVASEDWDHQWASESEYLHWCQLWSLQCCRVLKPNRCYYVWGTTKSDTFLRYKLDVINRIPEMVYQNWIVWAYDWGGRTKKTWPRKHEDLLMYSKGPEFPFYTDVIRVPYKVKKNVRRGVEQNPLGKVPTDVWTKNNHTTSHEYVDWHPTQKPLELLERIIKAHTRPGDTVLDIFSGSGSTAIACDNTSREFKGMRESRLDYWQKSCQRRRVWNPAVSDGAIRLSFQCTR